MTVSSVDFKAALSRWPSGVTVITVPDTGEHRATTVSAFASVSLVPPLVMVALNNDSISLTSLKRGGAFAVNILAAGQDEVSRQCAVPDRSGMDGLEYVIGLNGCALIDGAVVHLECAVHSIVPAGDHHVVMGLVSRATHSQSAPLVYWHRKYGAFKPAE